MKNFIILTVSYLCFFFTTMAQRFCVTNETLNIVYVGIDNPIAIAVENMSSKSIVVKTDNGSITGQNGQYSFHPDNVGPANIFMYKKINNQLKEIGRSPFRVKKIWDPIFRIGSGKDSINKKELEAQIFARAELEGNLDINFSLKSFVVCFVTTDTCRYVEIINLSNKIDEEIRSKFRTLKQNDIVIFKNIIAQGPDGNRNLAPRIITIFE